MRSFCLQKFGNNWPDARYPDSQDTVETLAVLNQADAHFSSWTFWESKIVWNLTSSDLNTNLAKVLARPFPQATAGTPIKVSTTPEYYNIICYVP